MVQLPESRWASACAGVAWVTILAVPVACGGGGGPARDGGGAMADAPVGDVAPEEAGSSEGGIDAVAAEAGDAAVGEGVDAGNEASTTGPGCPAVQYVQTCGVPAQCGPVVQVKELVQSPPTGQGGTILPGLYFATAFIVYRNQAGGPLGTFQETMNLSGNSFSVNAYFDGFEDTPTSGTYVASGTMITRTPACPAGLSAFSDSYTATATSLTLYEPGETAGETDEIVLTKQ